jgi:hypothetical protein
MTTGKTAGATASALPTGSTPVAANSNQPDDTTPTPTPAAPAAAMPVPQPEPTGMEEALERLADFNRIFLPKYNEDVHHAAGSVVELEKAIARIVDWKQLAASLDRPPLNQSFARELLKQVGFIVGSLNRHYLVQGAAEGGNAELRVSTFFRDVVGISLPDFLHRLGSHAQHPPYQSYLTYWLNNPACLTFTTDPGEKYFHRVVNETNRRFAVTSELLKPIQEGDWALNRSKTAAALKAAAEEIKPLHQLYNFLVKDPETRQPRMSIEFFMTVMRSYIAPISLDGIKIEGPNATYSPGWPRLDFAVGNRAPFYVDIVQRRYIWKTPEHRTLLDQALAIPSMPDQLLSQLGMDQQAFLQADVDAIRAKVVAIGEEFRACVVHYADLVQCLTDTSGTHISMIRNYLTKPAKNMSEVELARIVPRPDGGVGGNPLQETDEILRSRREHPVNSKLILVARALR